MQKKEKLEELTTTAVEALKMALEDCQHTTTGGFILAALALVAQVRDELACSGLSCNCDSK